MTFVLPWQKEGVPLDAFTERTLLRCAQSLPPLWAYPVTARRFAQGERLASAGEPLTQLSFVVEGCATVHTVMENGCAALQTEYRGVRSIGELELLMAYPTLTCDVRALTDGVLVCIPLPEATPRLLEDAAMLRFLGREVAHKLAQASRLAAQDRVYPLPARLAAYLLHAAQSGQTTLHLTRLNELLGGSYRHLLRTLRAFTDAGWVAREGGCLRVLDAQALARLAGEIRYD